MLERGWEVTACDISPAMVELARGKVGDAAELSVADMRELPELRRVRPGLVPRRRGQLPAQHARSWSGRWPGCGATSAPSGLLMFDVNTLRAYRTFFAEEVMVERGGRRLVWRGQASRRRAAGLDRRSELRGRAARRRGGPPIPPEMHRQRHFPEAEVLAALERAGLECLDVFGHGYDAVPKQPLDEVATPRPSTSPARLEAASHPRAGGPGGIGDPGPTPTEEPA